MRHIVPFSLPMCVPVIGCLLGALTMGSPWLVLAAGLAIAAVAWWTVLRAVSGSISLNGAGVASACVATLGGMYGFMSGFVIARDSTFPLAACLIAFSAGMIAGMMARSRARHEERIGRALVDISATPREGRALA